MGNFIKIKQFLKIFYVMSLDTPLKTKIFSFFASAEWYDSGSDTLTFFSKTCYIFGSFCRMEKSLGVSPMKIQPFFVSLICKTLRMGWYCLSSLMILIELLVNTCGYEWSLIFIIWGRHGGLASRPVGEKVIPRPFSFCWLESESHSSWRPWLP